MAMRRTRTNVGATSARSSSTPDLASKRALESARRELHQTQRQTTRDPFSRVRDNEMNALARRAGGQPQKTQTVPPLQNVLRTSSPTSTRRRPATTLLFQPQSQRLSGKQEFLDRSKQHSDDTEWVISSRPNLSQRAGFVTGVDAALRSMQQTKQQQLQRDRNQGKLWDAAGKARENLSINHYGDRLEKEDSLPPAVVFSSRVHNYFTERTVTERSDGETMREAMQENLDSTNVAFYSQGPEHEPQQQLSKQALKERLRLSKIHERRTKHEARILAAAEMEEAKKQQQQDQRIKGLARQKYGYLAKAHEREEKRLTTQDKKKADRLSMHKNFGPSAENTTLPGLQNKENSSNDYDSSRSSHSRSGLSTARFLTGGAVNAKARPIARRNASSLVFNDYN